MEYDNVERALLHISQGIAVVAMEHDYLIEAVCHYFALLTGLKSDWAKVRKCTGFSSSPKIMKPEIWAMSTRMFWPGLSYRSICNPRGKKVPTVSKFHEIRQNVYLGKIF
jgi:hypothetical protein